MTPQELKNSILQLAIQGKLVEQRTEEGTAEDILERICEEKIAVKKVAEDISDDETPYEIPGNWKWVRIENIAILYNGRAYKQNELLEQGKYPVLRVGNLFTNNKWYYSDLELDRKNYCQTGDLLYSWSASFGPHIWQGEYAIFHYHIWRIEHSIYVDKMYLYYALLADTERIKKSGHGLAMIHVTKASTEKRLLALPPLAEQKRIVSKIEELLPYINRYEQAWSKLEDFNKRFPVDMQKSILQTAIQGKLVEQRPEEGTGEELYRKIQSKHGTLKPSKSELNYDAMDIAIPENWKWVELNQIFRFVDYRGKTPNKISEGIFLITASNIRQGYMDYTRKEYISPEEFETRKSRGITQKGDLLFTTEAPMGNAALCDLDECSCGQRIITFQGYEEETVLPKLYMYFILSPQFQQQLLDNCTGTTAKGIKADKLKHFLLPLPPYAEQKRIVAKLEELLPLCERLKY